MDLLDDLMKMTTKQRRHFAETANDRDYRKALKLISYQCDTAFDHGDTKTEAYFDKMWVDINIERD